MKRKSSELPLHIAAANSLRRAGKIAMKRAKETKVPVAIWKDGKVAYMPSGPAKAGNPKVTTSIANASGRRRTFRTKASNIPV